MSKVRKPASTHLPRPANAHPPRRRLPVWKKAVFGLLTTVFFFAALEALLLALHVQPTLAEHDPFVGFESSIPLFVPAPEADHRAVLRTAPNKLAFFNDQQFSRHKPDDTVRIFCLGGSTVYGRPYDDTTAFSGWLRELLPAADSGKRWEVINAGGISYASYRVAAVMEELTAYQPDLFVVLTGHNEFLEQRTYETIRRTPAPLRKLAATLSRTRTYSVLHRAIRGEAAYDGSQPTTLPAEVDAILDHTVGPASYHRDDQLRQQILDHFAFNVDRMVDIAASADAAVVFVTPASNLKDFSPFKSQHDRRLNPSQRQAFALRFAEAELLEDQGDLDGALAAFQSAASIDPRVAAVHYRIGKVQFAQSRFDQARESLQRAVDEDVCPLRATLPIQQIVRQTAVRRSVPLVDFDAILQHDCLVRYGHHCPGDEYFLDHVHPDITTHRLLCLGIIDALVQMRIPAGAPSEDAVAAATERVMMRVDPRRQAIALGNLAQVLSWAGKKKEAGPIAIQAVQLREREGLPEHAESMYLAAVHYAVVGQTQAAIELLRNVVRLEPSNGEAHWRLGVMLYEQGEAEQALRHFQQAARLDPSDADIHQMIGAVHAQAGRFVDALQSFDVAYQQKPDDPHLQYDIALVHQQLGQDEQALEWYTRALLTSDDPFPIHRNVAQLMLKQGRNAEAVRHLEQALRVRPEANEIRDQLSEIRNRL